jgi:hypothetical protein
MNKQNGDTKMNKNEIINKAKSLSLCPSNSNSAESKPEIMPEFLSEIAVVERKVDFDTSVQFKLDDDVMKALFEECAAIKQFDAHLDVKFAERCAMQELKKLKTKQQTIVPARLDYWITIFGKENVLSEFDIINAMLDVECLPANPKNNTIMLNKLFQAEWDGYICSDEGPGIKTHKYTISKFYLEKAV